MRYKKTGAILILSALTAALAVTGCGRSGTISSLTDSDSTASIEEVVISDTVADVQTDTVAVPTIAAASVPEILPQTVGATTPAPIPDMTASSAAGAGQSAATSEVSLLPVESAVEVPAETASAASSADESADEAETTVSSESEAAEETPQESSEESYSAYITGDEVNVREEPTTDGGDDNVMFTLLEGDEVTVIEKQEGWVKISVNGKTGWMSSSYVERDE